MVTIRRASPDDIDWLITELRKFSQFIQTKRPVFEDEEFARNALTSLITSHYALIAEKEGTPIGFIGGLLTPHSMNPAIRVLCETFFWVTEDQRGARAGAMLLNEFLEHGKQNVDWILFALEEHSPMNEKSLLKRGFKRQERNYLLEVA